MDTTTTTPHSLIRLLVAGTLALVTVLLGRSVLGGASPESIHTLGLLAVAVCAYAWVLYPASVSVACSLVVLGALAWAWAVRQAGVLALDLAALLVLSAVAAVQRTFRATRLSRMQQKVDDLGEEQTVKEQAVAAAVRTREALQRKLGRYTQLQAIAEELSNLTEAEDIARLTVERAFELIGKSDVCLLFLVDHERQELSLYTSKRREAVPSIRAKHGDQFDRHVLRTHRPLLVNDIRRDFRFTISVSPERDISSVIACPLMFGQRPSGVLRLDSSTPAAYTQDDLRFLDILLDLVSTAMTNARLFVQTQQLAITDGLTGLMLRRPFLEQLPRELARAARSHEPVSLLMADVDHFKSYNDAFGHTAGDVVLKGVAEVLRTVAPAGALAARYGGEEFVVLLPRTSKVQAADLAEAIRRQVEQRVQSGAAAGSTARAGNRQRNRSVTVSIGVAAYPDDAQADLELLRVADQRLYQAKNSGRNLVCAT